MNTSHRILFSPGVVKIGIDEAANEHLLFVGDADSSTIYMAIPKSYPWNQRFCPRVLAGDAEERSPHPERVIARHEA